MTDFQVAGILLTLAALLAYANTRFLRLPAAIGMTAVALMTSLFVLGLDAAGVHVVAQRVSAMLGSAELGDTLLHGVLGFLLFAGALHVDLAELAEHRRAIAVLAMLGTAISTLLIAVASYAAARWIGLPLSFLECALFGTLISPTDPVAVLAILRSAGAPRSLELTITGESLFNDGIGVVAFLAVLELAGGATISAGGVAILFAREVLGGLGYGLAIGYVAFRMLRSIDDYTVEVLITLALVGGGYAGAEALHVSAPIAAVVCGLLIGNHGRRLAMSDTTRQRVDSFWELIDHVLNALLFLVLGLEIVRLPIGGAVAALGACAVVIALAARLISVTVPLAALSGFRRASPGAALILTWGGLRGGLSVALALSLPIGPARDAILVATYGVVIFSVLVQGLTVGRVARAITARSAATDESRKLPR